MSNRYFYLRMNLSIMTRRVKPSDAVQQSSDALRYKMIMILSISINSIDALRHDNDTQSHFYFYNDNETESQYRIPLCNYYTHK